MGTRGTLFLLLLFGAVGELNGQPAAEQVTAVHAELGPGAAPTQAAGVPIAIYLPMRYHKELVVGKSTGWGFVGMAAAALHAYSKEWVPLAPIPRGSGQNVSALMCDVCPSEEACTAEATYNCAHRTLLGDKLAGQRFSPARAAIGGGLFMTEANVPQKADRIPAALFMGGFGPDGRTLPFTVSLAPAATSITVTALDILITRGYTRVSYVACDTAEDRVKAGALGTMAAERGIQVMPHYFPKSDLVFGVNQQAEPKWREQLLGMVQFDAHAHVLDMDPKCPTWDIMHWLEDNGRMGAGFVWIGTCDRSAYETFYLPRIRESPMRRWFYGRPFDGFILLKEASENRVYDAFWSWWPTVLARKNEVLGWPGPEVKSGAFSRREAMIYLFEPKGYYAFDAVWAMLLAIDYAAQKYGVNFTGGELYEELRSLDFQGTSGRVKFDSNGARMLDLQLLQVSYELATTTTTTTTTTTSGATKCIVPALTDTAAVGAYMGCIKAACEDAASTLILALTGFKLTSCADAATQGRCSTPLTDFTPLAPPGVKMDVVCPKSCKSCGGGGGAIPVPDCRVPSNMSQVSLTYYLQCLRVSCADAVPAGIQRLTGGAHASCAALNSSVAGDCGANLTTAFPFLPLGTQLGHLCPQMCPTFCDVRPTSCITDDWFSAMAEGGNFAVCARLACISIPSIPQIWGGGDCAAAISVGCGFDISIMAAGVQSPLYAGWMCPEWCPGFCAYTNSSRSTNSAPGLAMAFTSIGTYFGNLTLNPAGVRFYGGAAQWPPDKNKNCSVGQVYNSRTSVCYDCEPGTYAEEIGLSSCSTCRGGTYSGKGADKCIPCLPGTYSAAAGSSVCASCPKGRYSGKALETECQDCLAGKYADQDGLSDCTVCNTSNFQNRSGQSSCLACPELMEASTAGATQAEDCKCQKDSYLVLAGDGGLRECRRCPFWLVCEGKDSPPLQAKGYAVWNYTYPHQVVTCSSDQECPPNRPLGQCLEHRDGLACNLCEPDFFDDAGVCQNCAQNTNSALPLALTAACVVLLSGALLLFAAMEAGVQRPGTSTAIMTAGLFATTVQSLAAFTKLSISWVEPMSSLRRLLSIIAFRVELLNVGCVFRTNSPGWTFAAALLTYPCVVVVLFIGSLLIRICRRRIPPEKVWNAQGIIMMVVYLSLSLMVVSPFQCSENPDGTLSMLSQRSVLCWRSRDHAVLVAMAGVGLVVYVASFPSFVLWANLVYPRRVARQAGAFLRKYAFLFSRFHPTRYYYSFIYVTRNLSLALIPPLFSRLIILQLLSMTFVIGLTGLIQTRIFPWNTRIANILDGIFNLVMIEVLMVGALLGNFDAQGSVEVGRWFLSGVLLLIPAGAVIVLLTVVHRNFLSKKRFGIFLTHHKESAGMLARWFKLELSELIKEQVFLDSDDLDRLDEIPATVAHDTEYLVALLTRETLARPWCAVEVTHAYRSGVAVIPVACADYEGVSDDFLHKLPDLWSDSQRSVMSAAGVEVADIVEAYQAFRLLDPIRLKARSDLQHQHDVLLQLVERCSRLRKNLFLQSALALGRRVSATEDCDILILLDSEYAEAVTTGWVLRRLLQRQLQVPVSVALGATDPQFEEQLLEAKYLIVLLTPSTLQSPAFAAALTLALQTGRIEAIPVLAGSSFSFPDAGHWQRVSVGQVLNPSDKALQGVDLESVVQSFKALLGVLASHFSPHASSKVQKLEVEELSRRLGAFSAVRSNHTPTVAPTALQGQGSSVWLRSDSAAEQHGAGHSPTKESGHVALITAKTNRSLVQAMEDSTWSSDDARMIFSEGFQHWPDDAASVELEVAATKDQPRVQALPQDRAIRFPRSWGRELTDEGA